MMEKSGLSCIVHLHDPGPYRLLLNFY